MANYVSSYTGSQHDQYVMASQIVNLIYPVGSIYMSVNNTSPATLFGGTWEQIQDKFLLCSGKTYSGGSTGGEATHTLTVDETPEHTHTRGTMNITGGVGPLDDMSAGWFSGAMYRGAGHSYDASSSSSGSGWRLMFDASRSWTGETSPVGGGSAHNNMPPYLAVYVWKRLS